MTMLQRALERYPQEMARITRGHTIALTGGVTLHGCGLAAVRSSSVPSRAYTVNGHCICPDVSKAPDGRCKHRWAKALYSKALTYLIQNESDVPELPEPYSFPQWTRYKATYQGPQSAGHRVDGIAELIEDGLFYFSPATDDHGGWMAEYHEVALGPGIEGEVA